MRIFLIGKSLANSAFSEYFTQDSNNIVFSTEDESSAEFVDIAQDNTSELKEFALANEINLTILCNESSMQSGISKEFSEAGLAVAAPDGSALRIVSSKSFAKRFIYRNKILTPRFQIFEKPQAAIDYIRQNKFPCVIKPDAHSEISTRICETFGAAKSAIEEFFDTGSKKIITEEYIQGKEFSVYVLCDGYNPVILGNCATYQNSIAKFDADFLSEDLKNNIRENILSPLICALAKETGEYTGILGFDFILSNGRCYLLECNSFFKDIDADMFVNAIDEDWIKLFESALSGTLCEEYKNIKTKERYFYASQFWQNSQKINICTSGRTNNEAKERLIEECPCQKELEEAQKIWKY